MKAVCRDGKCKLEPCSESLDYHCKRCSHVYILDVMHRKVVDSARKHAVKDFKRDLLALLGVEDELIALQDQIAYMNEEQ